MQRRKKKSVCKETFVRKKTKNKNHSYDPLIFNSAMPCVYSGSRVIETSIQGVAGLLQPVTMAAQWLSGLIVSLCLLI